METPVWNSMVPAARSLERTFFRFFWIAFSVASNTWSIPPVKTWTFGSAASAALGNAIKEANRTNRSESLELLIVKPNMLRGYPKGMLRRSVCALDCPDACGMLVDIEDGARDAAAGQS